MIKTLFYFLLLYPKNSVSQVSENINSKNTSENVMIESEESLRRIVNGTPANLLNTPYLVSFKIEYSIVDLFYNFCAGTLIGTNKILTAAHCFKQVSGFCEVVVAVMDNPFHHDYRSRPAGHGQWRRLKDCLLYDDYGFIRHDISVVFTRYPFHLNDHVKVINFAKVFKDYSGKKCVIAGFGRTDNKLKINTEILLTTHVKVLPPSFCGMLMKKRNESSIICTGQDASYAAKGDSGGPLVCQNTGDPEEIPKLGILVGICSLHMTMSPQTLYTRTSAYVDFIKNAKRLRLPDDKRGGHETTSKGRFLCLGSIVTIHTGPIRNSTIPSASWLNALRVRSGTPAKLGDVPYQVSFKVFAHLRRLYSSFCGGSLIKPNKILTAAHCFATANKGFLNSCFGSHNFKKTGNIRAVMGSLTNKLAENEEGQWRKIDHFKVPAGFRFPKQDICIVFTTEPFDLNDHVKIINYAKVVKDYEGECLIAGYGKIDSKVTSKKLLMASVTLMRIDQCSKIYKQNMRKQICLSTKVQNSDTDKGDSGGPLVCTNTGDPEEIPGLGLLVGVTSGGTPSMKNSFFTRVTSYKNYIERNCTAQLNIYRFYILIPILLSVMQKML